VYPNPIQFEVRERQLEKGLAFRLESPSLAADTADWYDDFAAEELR